MQYEKVYIQKTRSGSVIKETVADFDIYCADMPFKLFVEAKEPAKRDWLDEHGDDEYIPDGGLKMKAYTMDVKFCCKRLSCSILIEHFLCPIIRHRRLPLRKINQSSRSGDHICLAARMGAAFFI